MECTFKLEREVAVTTEELVVQTVMVITLIFTGERSGLALGWWALENPLKLDGHCTEPLLEKEETSCHHKMAGSWWMMEVRTEREWGGRG